jgi:hypothetical protein
MSAQGRRWGANAAMLEQQLGGGMEGLGGGESVLLPRCSLSLALYALAALIRMVYTWASCCPGRLTALAAALAMALLALHSVPRDGIIISSGLFPPLSCGHTTFLELPINYLDVINDLL